MAGTTTRGARLAQPQARYEQRRVKHGVRKTVSQLLAEGEWLRGLLSSRTHAQRLAEMTPAARERTARFEQLRAKIGPLKGFNVVEELRRIRDGK
ncbi:MAG: hypothetical protein ABSE73_20595 [Planctomycetota bacterium]